jgi:hypothetical protein
MAGAFSASAIATAAAFEKSSDKSKKNGRNVKEIGSKKSEKNPIVQAIQMGVNNSSSSSSSRSSSSSSSSGGAELNLILFDEVLYSL